MTVAENVDVDLGPDRQASLQRIVWSSVIGTAVEWYDFLIYGAATALDRSLLQSPTGQDWCWPVLDALECNSIPTALTTEPKPFKVGFKVRNKEALERWIAASDERTKDL